MDGVRLSLKLLESDFKKCAFMYHYKVLFFFIHPFWFLVP